MKVEGRYEMPDLDALKGVEYADPVEQFRRMSETVGGKVVSLGEGEDVNMLIKRIVR